MRQSQPTIATVQAIYISLHGGGPSGIDSAHRLNYHNQALQSCLPPAQGYRAGYWQVEERYRGQERRPQNLPVTDGGFQTEY